MRNSKLLAFLAALAIAGWNHALALNEPSPAVPLAPRPLNEPLNEKLTTEAWEAYQAGRYAIAITTADQCLFSFREAANRIQAILESEKATLPTGKLSEADRLRIGRYQILHDVATCFLVKGWAEEKLGHAEEARKTYAEAKNYTQARSSRPTGDSFWSPAEKASALLLK
jgi:tetratricopeptide (TPR) repeat protein